jgi:hypothetical protein
MRNRIVYSGLAQDEVRTEFRVAVYPVAVYRMPEGAHWCAVEDNSLRFFTVKKPAGGSFNRVI